MVFLALALVLITPLSTAIQSCRKHVILWGVHVTLSTILPQTLDLCVDVFYWFDKSTKRKGILREFCGFCDSDYREVVRYVSVRWLSLEKAVYRILQL